MLLLLTFVALGGSLIWTGLTVIDGRTMLFAAIALVVRTAVLYPMLAGVRLGEHERRIIALFGPRGLSSLLFALLPVFAGVEGAEYIFTVTCLVVLLSVVLHGGGIALFLRANAPRQALPPAPVQGVRTMPVLEGVDASALSSAERSTGADDDVQRITLAELRELRAGGASVTIVDARAERSYGADDIQAVGAVRVAPDDAVRSATAIGLSHHGTLVIYCA
jgi:hypothetical protein